MVSGVEQLRARSPSSPIERIDVIDKIHDYETDTSESVVRALLLEQCAEWGDRSLSYLRTSGTDNAMWRIHCAHMTDLVVRLPRIEKAVAAVVKELALLPILERSLPGVNVPTLRHHGIPTTVFPYPWAVLEWRDGVDAWTARNDLFDANPEGLALDLAHAVQAIGSVVGVELPGRSPGDRGGPVGPLLDRLEEWLTDPQWNAASLLDIAAVRRCAHESREVASEIDVRFVHGDLIAGNILVQSNRLAAVIDWGGSGIGDPAQDLAPAWSIFAKHGRATFHEAVNASPEMWLRARAFELEHAVGGILYYRPKNHPLGDVMTRTLHRILTNE
jgi:aminoglycoside phosphotransferase (APT) family kinase protein